MYLLAAIHDAKDRRTDRQTDRQTDGHTLVERKSAKKDNIKHMTYVHETYTRNFTCLTFFSCTSFLLYKGFLRRIECNYYVHCVQEFAWTCFKIRLMKLAQDICRSDLGRLKKNNYNKMSSYITRSVPGLKMKSIIPQAK